MSLLKSLKCLCMEFCPTYIEFLDPSLEDADDDFSWKIIQPIDFHNLELSLERRERDKGCGRGFCDTIDDINIYSESKSLD